MLQYQGVIGNLAFQFHLENSILEYKQAAEKAIRRAC
jgi:hypothetical protein